jgi:hypothetical protein
MQNEINLNKNENHLIFERVKKEAIECLESLTTHGVPNLTRTKYCLIRFIWVLLTLSSAGLSVYFVINTLIEFSHFNVTTEVRLINSNQPFEFPKISICNKHRFSTKYSINYLKNLVKSKYNYSFDELFDPSFFNQSLSFSAKYFIQDNLTTYLFSDIEMNERKRYSLSMQDSLEFCKFNDQDCSYLDFEWFFNSKYGNCYKFNSNGLKTTNQINQDGGLIFELSLKNPKEIEMLELEKGVYVSIDSNKLDSYSVFENLIEVPTGFQTSIRIEKSLFKKYPKPYSDCDLNGSIDSLKPEQKAIYNEIIKANLSYSHSLCLIFCRHKLYSKQFGCKFRVNSLRFPNIKYCTLSKNLSIYENELNYRTNATNSCIDQCPMECETIKYDTDIFFTKYPEIYLKDVKYSYESLNNVNDERQNITLDDLLILKIFYGTFSYISYKASPSMSFYGLVSNLGGTLGLFLGNFTLFKLKNDFFKLNKFD